MSCTKQEDFDLAAIRARLEGARGPRYWRSLEELADTEGFQEFLHREFPRQASEWEDDEPGRRKFLKLMGASLALAGLSACTRQPDETIMPYVRAPEEIVPGRPLYFATAMPLGGSAIGLLAESHMGRPTKIEGNPEHPASLGAADVFAQASVLGLYDPDRSQTITRYGEISTYTSFLGEFRVAVAEQKAKQGAGLRILTETVISPTLAGQLEQLLRDFPLARWHQYEPASPDAARAGARMAFGEAVAARYEIAKADVILSLDADFMGAPGAGVRYARDFSGRRKARGHDAALSRLYVVESAPSITGAKADHRWGMKSAEIAAVAAWVARETGVDTSALQVEGQPPSWVKHVAADLASNKGRCLVIPGEQQPPIVHALAHAMNQALNNAGKTIFYTEPVEARPEDQVESLRTLVKQMESGTVELLVILGGNPAYNAPGDIRFRENLSKVKLRVRLGLYDDETSEICHWQIPEAHYLETWSDTRAFDGTVTIQQPLIAPLYRGKSPHELLAAFTAMPEQSSYDIVRAYWRQRKPGVEFESWWRKAVHDGVVEGTAAAVRTVAARRLPPMTLAVQPGTEILFRTDPHVYDGRFANNGWLQEAPKPLTKLTWDNAALVSPSMAEKHRFSNGDEIELKYRGKTLRAPVWIVPGQPAESITVNLGYGRTRAGRVATGAGFNAYVLRTSDAPWSGEGVEFRRTGRRQELATTQGHWSMEGRALLRSGTVAQYKADPAFVHKMGHEPPVELTLYPPVKYEGRAWGMAVDLGACNGCNACVVACVAENNIPVVGKEQVAKGREMHWIRVDRYYEGDLDAPSQHFQPVLCQHCENAPCEVVCPVSATVHSSEGLNDMVYNRCVGTRYCSHNCPYKVRRFNFLLYSDYDHETIAMQKNPDVTVRSRGVMEKCSYCVQRINRVVIDAEREGRAVRDGEVLTACQQTCPTQAIVFGDINDPHSRVAQLKKEELNYGLLAELNTRPRTTYLASIRNPNPEIGPLETRAPEHKA